MTKTEKRIKFFEFFSKLTEFSKQSNIHFLVIWYNRTEAQQAELYAYGRTQPGKKRTGCDGHTNRSPHQDWLAMDIVIVQDGVLQWSRISEYEVLGMEWKQMGGTWGGDWDSDHVIEKNDYDIYHFQWSDSLV